MWVDATLADAATVVDDKVYALGMGWNAINASAFPAMHQRMALVVIIRATYTECGEDHQLEIHLEDADGHRLGIGAGGSDLFAATFNAGRSPFEGDERVVPVVLTVDQVTFPAAGRYNWVVEIDGDERARLPMRLTLIGS